MEEKLNLREYIKEFINGNKELFGKRFLMTIILKI